MSFLSHIREDILLDFYVEWQLDVLCIPHFDVERIFHINIRLKIENALHKSISAILPSVTGSMVSFISYRFSPIVVMSSALNLSGKKIFFTLALEQNIHRYQPTPPV